jgi:hypothetical protein
MPPENLFQLLQPQMATTQAVSTGVAHDEINSLIYKKKEIEPSLLDFIRKSVSTVEGLEPEDTSYGRAIAQLVEESYSPHIKQMDLEGFKTYGQVTKRERPLSEWQKEQREKHGWTRFTSVDAGDIWEKKLDKKTGKWYTTRPRAFFRTDTQRIEGKKDGLWESIGTDTTFTTPGNLDELISELSHQLQYGSLNIEQRKSLEKRRRKEKKEYGEGVYDLLNTMEGEAHNIIEPTIRKRFKTLLDSLSAPITVESLFQNQ